MEQTIYGLVHLDYSPDYRFEVISLEDDLEIKQEYCCICRILSLFKLRYLTANNYEVYRFADIFTTSEYRYDTISGHIRDITTINFLSKMVVHPKIDPLLLSVILQDCELVDKYIRDTRSNRIDAFNFCMKRSISCCTKSLSKNNNKYLDVLEKEIVTKIMFCRSIFSSYSNDISKYIIANGMLN